MKISLDKKKFSEYFKAFEELKKTIEKDLSIVLNLTDYNNKVEVGYLHLREEFQSDCDGDNDLVIAEVNLKIKCEKSKELFQTFMKDNQRYYNMRVKETRLSEWGDEYKFEIDCYY